MQRKSARTVAEIVDNIRRVFQVVNEQSKKVERETGVTGPQLWAMKVIAENAPIKGAEIARRMYLHPTTVVGILDRLEARGLITKTRSVVDRRVVDVDLTEQGRNLLANAPEVAQGALVRGLEGIEEERLLRIADGLEQLVHLLGVEEIPPKLILSAEVNLPKKQAGEKPAAKKRR